MNINEIFKFKVLNSEISIIGYNIWICWKYNRLAKINKALKIKLKHFLLKNTSIIIIFQLFNGLKLFVVALSRCLQSEKICKTPIESSLQMQRTALWNEQRVIPSHRLTVTPALILKINFFEWYELYFVNFFTYD